MMTTNMVVDEETIRRYEARIKELERENKELKRKQMEISTAKELYLKIFEDFPALIWRSRLDKLCDYFNKTWLKWTGRTMEQEFGNGWANSVHPDDFDRCLETYVAAFERREYFYMEYRLIDKHGEYRWIGDHGTPFFDLDDTFLGYIGSCYDITDIKLNEQKLRKLNATKDKFFSIVAHDLRNPMSAFVSASELLMESTSSQDLDATETAELAALMHKDAKNTLMLLENLLEWSKAQADDIGFAPTWISIPELFEQVLSQVEMNAKAKQIQISTVMNLDANNTTSSNTPFIWYADKNMLTTVLRNLLMNAIKFTNHGGLIQLKASMTTVVPPQDNYSSTTAGQVGQDDHDTEVLLISVQDNGVGIPPDQLETLFDLVKNGDTVSQLGTDQEKGSGLGLVICKEFVSKHGGIIWAESEVGQGTEFKLTLANLNPNKNNPPFSSTAVAIGEAMET